MENSSGLAIMQENTSASASVVETEDNKRIEDIVARVQFAVKMLKRSSFFRDFQRQMRHPKLVARIRKVIAADPQHSQLQLVLYGVGVLENVVGGPRVEMCNSTQLAFVILLRKKFQWVSDIVVYDPSVPPVQQKAINAFNCTFLSVNEYGKRTVERPTLFFIPHCPTGLIDNVLLANWTPTNLNKIIILCDSFKGIKKDIYRIRYLLSLKHLQAILHSDDILHETPLPEPPETDEINRRAFSRFSWHFFTLDGSIEHLNLDLFPEVLPNNSSVDAMLLNAVVRQARTF